MSMIRWLKETPRVAYLGYYFLQDQPKYEGNFYEIRSSGVYYRCELDAAAVAEKISQYSGNIARMKAVSEIDPKTEQHVLHYVLSEELCSLKDNMPNTILKKNVPQSIQGQGHYMISVCCFCSRYSRKNYCNMCAAKYSTIEERLKNSKTVYNELRNSGGLASSEQLLKENKPLIIEEIIKPFENDDHAFVQLLLARDKNGNSPLFYSYTKIPIDKKNIKPLLDRIKNLKNKEDKWAILKTFIHALVAQEVNLDDAITCFGADLIKNAMFITDEHGNTPFHMVSSNPESLLMFEAMCRLFPSNPIRVEEKSNTSMLDAVFFCQNHNGLNPLHYAVKNRNDALIRKIFSLHEQQNKELENKNDDESVFYKTIAMMKDKDGE
ncbi:MAG TPA: hypothetical protein VGW78_04965, partial [Candidatus Babeliales bacterium]|nr:hypothetical protein [Candidatus Babeliales bacterium]